jgi:hypothetical protein
LQSAAVDGYSRQIFLSLACSPVSMHLAYLMLGTAVMAGFGFFFWLINARFFHHRCNGSTARGFACHQAYDKWHTTRCIFFTCISGTICRVLRIRASLYRNGAVGLGYIFHALRSRFRSWLCACRHGFFWIAEIRAYRRSSAADYHYSWGDGFRSLRYICSGCFKHGTATQILSEYQPME